MSRTNTINDFEKMVADANQVKTNLEDEIASLKASISGIEEKKNSAAENGDVEAFRAEKRKLEDVKDSIEIKTAQLKKLANPVTETMVNNFWKDYSSAYNKDFEKKLALFTEKKKELLSMYNEMLNLQTEAITMRERLAALIGLKNAPTDYSGSAIDNAFKFKHIPYVNGKTSIAGSGVTDPDAVYYLSSLHKGGMDSEWASICKNSKIAELYKFLVYRRINA